MFSFTRSRSRHRLRKIPGSGAAPKQAGSETLLLSLIVFDEYISLLIIEYMYANNSKSKTFKLITQHSCSKYDSCVQQTEPFHAIISS